MEEDELMYRVRGVMIYDNNKPLLCVCVCVCVLYFLKGTRKLL